MAMGYVICTMVNGGQRKQSYPQEEACGLHPNLQYGVIVGLAHQATFHDTLFLE